MNTKNNNDLIKQINNYSKEALESLIKEAEHFLEIASARLHSIKDKEIEESLQKYLGKYYMDIYDSHASYYRVVTIANTAVIMAEFDKYTDSDNWTFHGKSNFWTNYHLEIVDVSAEYIEHELTEITQEEYEIAVKSRLQEMQDKCLFPKISDGGDNK